MKTSTGPRREHDFNRVERNPNPIPKQDQTNMKPRPNQDHTREDRDGSKTKPGPDQDQHKTRPRPNRSETTHQNQTKTKKTPHTRTKTCKLTKSCCRLGPVVMVLGIVLSPGRRAHFSSIGTGIRLVMRGASILFYLVKR